jgi:hypothetical protein
MTNFSILVEHFSFMWVIKIHVTLITILKSYHCGQRHWSFPENLLCCPSVLQYLRVYIILTAFGCYSMSFETHILLSSLWDVCRICISAFTGVPEILIFKQPLTIGRTFSNVCTLSLLCDWLYYWFSFWLAIFYLQFNFCN